MTVTKYMLEKITSYDIFNNLLPGTVFCYLVEKFTRFDYITGPIWQKLFLYYFVGVLLSRLGSLVVERALKNLKIINFAKYTDYIYASQEDHTIQILNEKNNMYRTIIAMFFVFTLTLLLDWFCLDSFLKLTISRRRIMIIGILFLFIILFIFSYRKQTKYISDCVASQTQKEEK